MPIYEYRCVPCRRETTVFVPRVTEVAPPACPACGQAMARRFSTFAYHRSESDRAARAGDPDQPGPDYYQDPRNIGRWAEKKFEEMGVELPGEIKEKISAARDGALPESVKDL